MNGALLDKFLSCLNTALRDSLYGLLRVLALGLAVYDTLHKLTSPNDGESKEVNNDRDREVKRVRFPMAFTRLIILDFACFSDFIFACLIWLQRGVLFELDAMNPSHQIRCKNRYFSNLG